MKVEQRWIVCKEVLHDISYGIDGAEVSLSIGAVHSTLSAAMQHMADCVAGGKYDCFIISAFVPVEG